MRNGQLVRRKYQIMSNSKRNKDQVKEHFSRKMAILTEACASGEVTAEEFRVYFALLVVYHNNEDDYCRPTDERLGWSCATCTRSVGTHTRSLQAKDRLNKKPTRGASIYTFPGLPALEGRQGAAEDHEIRSATQSKKVGRLEQEGRHTACRAEPSTKPSTEPSTLYEAHDDVGIQEEVNEAQSLTITTEGQFELFWSAYPHKVDKPAALRAFRTAIKVVPLDVMLAGIKRYAADKPPKNQWCNPATFLKGERWGDKPAKVDDDGGVHQRSDGMWEISHGTLQYEAYRREALKANSGTVYKFPDTPGHIAVCASQWPRTKGRAYGSG
jgi:hypothetical protein